MTMQQWAEALASKLIPGTSTPTTWPYSSFFDWFSSPAACGYLPSILPLNALGGLPPGTGIQNEDYVVNQNYLFLGLNPSRPFFTIPATATKPRDLNQRNWINFNLAGEPGTEWESWDNVGDFAKAVCPCSAFYSSCYPKFHGAYMADLAPFVTESNGKAAKELIRANLGVHQATFAGEMDQYRLVVHPAATNFAGLNIILLGGDAWEVARLFLSTFTATFPGATLWKCHHYARDWHPELVDELAAIASCGPGTKPPFIIV